MPSIFTNDTSRGPLYQYWKDRAAEEKGLRTQRIDETRIRSHGLQPMSAAYGPSSSESYQHRHDSDVPGHGGALEQQYTGNAGVGVNPVQGMNDMGDDLPPYIDTTQQHPSALASHPSAPPSTHAQTHAQGEHLLSSSEEKSRLAALAHRHRASETDSDAAIAQTLSSELNREELPRRGSSVEAGEHGEGHGEGERKLSGKERRRSMVGKVGTWLADAASGYTRRQERW